MVFTKVFRRRYLDVVLTFKNRISLLNMGDEEDWTIFEGEPFFLREIRRGSKQFKAVKSVKPSTSDKTWDARYYDDMGILVLEKDIEELPVGQTLYIEHQVADPSHMDLNCIIQACRIYAKDVGRKYVSALDPCKARGSSGEWAIGITPRLFKDLREHDIKYHI